MRYRVPQNVQREDKIVWILSLRQLILVMCGCGFSYWLYLQLAESFILTEIELALIAIPGILSIMFAFLTIKGMALHEFLLILIEQSFYRSPRRMWQAHGGEPFMSMTRDYGQKAQKTDNPVARPAYSRRRVEDLAALLDGDSASLPPAA